MQIDSILADGATTAFDDFHRRSEARRGARGSDVTPG
jgi:hypothetical protein